MLKISVISLAIAGFISIILFSCCVASSAEVIGAKDIDAMIPMFDSYAEQTFEKSGVPGMAVAIVRNNTTVYLRCFGVGNISSKKSITPDTRFQLASISKIFSSTLIASMVGNDELSWDDRVASMIPGFQLFDSWVTDHVTIRDLLSHRSGLPEFGASILDDMFRYSRSDIIHRLRFLTLTGEFRSSYAYSNAGILVAAEAASKKAGKEYEDLLMERICIPAGLTNTSPRYADFINTEDRADSYGVMNRTPVAGFSKNLDAFSASGGVSSTINDMIRFARLLINDGTIDGKEVIAADALRETYVPLYIRAYSAKGMTASALGWDTYLENGHRRVEKGGDLDNGVSTFIVLYPEERLSIVILTNGWPGGQVLKNAIKKGFDDLYFKGKIPEDWYTIGEKNMYETLKPGGQIISGPLANPPGTAQPPRPLFSYAGSFSQDYYGTVRIVPEESDLLVYPGLNEMPFSLVPYDGDTFRDTSSDTLVTFTPGPDGNATSVWFSQLETPYNNGIFALTST